MNAMATSEWEMREMTTEQPHRLWRQLASSIENNRDEANHSSHAVNCSFSVTRVDVDHSVGLLGGSSSGCGR
jgi:hypothetical protein